MKFGKLLIFAFLGLTQATLEIIFDKDKMEKEVKDAESWIGDLWKEPSMKTYNDKIYDAFINTRVLI